MSLFTSSTPTIETITFNEEQTLFTCSTSNGFRVYDIARMELKFLVKVGNTKFAKILNRTNIVIFILNEPEGEYKANVPYLWDDDKKKVISYLSTNVDEPINSIDITKNVIVTATNKNIYIYDSKTLKCIKTLFTYNNTRGIFTISGDKIIYPGPNIGEIMISPLNDPPADTASSDIVYSEIIQAHQTEIHTIKVSQDRQFIITASDTGTLIRFFDYNGKHEQKKELRRGVIPAMISNIDTNQKYMCLSSDKYTLHIYDMYKENIFSALSYIPFIKYTQSEWSKLQIQLENAAQHTCIFLNENKILVLFYDGTYKIYKFDMETNEISVDKESCFLL